ncbi:MAG: hydroxymethylbilane synthase [Phycisphaerae bacterium]|nr:hydroxymethylbilane synthase [Phycisphaerae bacterium]
MARDRIVIGTRGSLLALAQTDWVAQQIRAACPGLSVELRRIQTTGDKRPTDAIPEIGQKGLFTFELEQALLAAEIDLAVHSAKDLPTETPEALDLLWVPPREDARDALVTREAKGLRDLPAGAVVGTSSLRRQAQLRMIRPDLSFIALRGNIDTRIRKVHRGDCDAGVLALAGLRRAGFEEHMTEPLEVDVMISAPGQGILAVQGRRDDDELRALLAPLDDAMTREALLCERWIVDQLAGGCRTPIGAWIRAADRRLRGDAIVALPDGSKHARTTAEADEWRSLADAIVADLRRQDADAIIAASRE